MSFTTCLINFIIFFHKNWHLFGIYSACRIVNHNLHDTVNGTKSKWVGTIILIYYLCWDRRKTPASVWDTWLFIYIRSQTPIGSVTQFLDKNFLLECASLIVLIFAGEHVYSGCSECFLNPVISQDQKLNSETQTFSGFLTKCFPFTLKREKPSTHKVLKKTSIFQ